MRIALLVVILLGLCLPLLAQNADTAPPPSRTPATSAEKPADAPKTDAPAATKNGESGKENGKTDSKEPTHILNIVASPKGWTIHAVNADAHELFTQFAAAAHLPLVVDDTVKRKITLHISDKSECDILSIIVDAYGFSWAQVEGVHIVSDGMPKTASSYLLSDIASVTTKYVAPDRAQQLLPLFLQQHVKVNTDQNAVVLCGPKPMLEKFRQDVEQFDVAAAQIMLDVNVIEFTDVGTDVFASLIGHSNANFGVVTDSLTGQVTLTAVADLPTLFFSELRALVTKRQARVRANPRIATVSGQSANIFIGQQQYLTVPLNTGANSIDAGVSLTMTPLTGGGGEIILDLREEISTLSAPDPTTGLPTKTSRTGQSTVRVRDGQTIIMGGLRQIESREVRRAIPILSEMPLLGKFFRSNRTEKTAVDLAIFVTARTLSQTGHLPAEEEQKAREMIEGVNR